MTDIYMLSSRWEGTEENLLLEKKKSCSDQKQRGREVERKGKNTTGDKTKISLSLFIPCFLSPNVGEYMNNKIMGRGGGTHKKIKIHQKNKKF